MKKHRYKNIGYYALLKSKRTIRSVLAAERFDMTHGSDVPSSIFSAVNDMLDLLVQLQNFTPSESLFDCSENVSYTSKKLPTIYFTMLQKSHERREIAKVFWLSTNQNFSDAFSKSRLSQALQHMLVTKKIKVTPQLNGTR